MLLSERLARPFGRTGASVPFIGQGTWDMPERGPRLDEAKRALLRGVELGLTHVDTAEMYGSGRVEELLGETLAGVAREKLFVASKVLPSHARYRDTIAACERTLQRLRMEYLDLYMLHWPSEYPLEETMRALADLVRRGLIRYAGVSNFEASDMLQAASYLDGVPLACNQVLYNLGQRGVERELIPAARENGIAIVAYTPFGRGSFATEAMPGGALHAIAEKHGATPRQVILAFLTRDRNVFTIPKASHVEHVEQNAAAAMVHLDEGDVRAIDRAFPVGPPGPLATL